MNLKSIVGLLSVLTLIPLSVDGALGMEFMSYTVRGNYLSYALLLLALFFQLLIDSKDSKASKTRDFLIQNLVSSRTSLLCGMALFLVAGILGCFASENTKRSVFFLVWTTGTIFSLPVATSLVVRLWGLTVYRVFALYVSLHALLVIVDGTLCHLPGHPSLGRINIPDDLGGCRPYGFYQEPNYFAAFTLLAASTLFASLRFESNLKWKRFILASLLLCYLSVLASTSKMGILGVLAVAVVHGVHFLKSKIDLRKKLKPKPLIASLAVGALALLLILQNHYVLQAIQYSLNIGGLAGTSLRQKNSAVALELLSRHPAFGVGPGGSGAYIGHHLDTLPSAQTFYEVRRPESLEKMANDPFFFSMPAEVSAEWGLVGALGLCLILFGLFKEMRGTRLAVFGVSLAMVSSTWQTLPRFDLWTALALLFALELPLPQLKTRSNGAR